MGYTTQFSGELKFTQEITTKALAKLQSFFGEDCRDHPEWGRPDLTYIDLELTKEFDGVKWDGSAKTYDLVDKVNLVISEMKKEYPNFGLEGTLTAQGEDIMDRWSLTMKDGVATANELVVEGTIVTCPHCEEKFILKTEKNDN